LAWLPFLLLVVIVDGFSGTGASCAFERGCAESGKQVPHRAFSPIRNDKVSFVGFEVSFVGFEVSFVGFALSRFDAVLF
jgi:hypothetical protein